MTFMIYATKTGCCGGQAVHYRVSRFLDYKKHGPDMPKSFQIIKLSLGMMTHKAHPCISFWYNRCRQDMASWSCIIPRLSLFANSLALPSLLRLVELQQFLYLSIIWKFSFFTGVEPFRYNFVILYLLRTFILLVWVRGSGWKHPAYSMASVSILAGILTLFADRLVINDGKGLN